MNRRVVASGRSCFECRRRKIKCDRALPCAYCTRIKLQCTYPSKRLNTTTNEGGDLATRVQSVECALQSLEQKITHIGDLLQVNQQLSNRRDRSEKHHRFPIDITHDLPSPSLSSQINSLSSQSQNSTPIKATRSHLLQSLPFNDLVDAPQSLESFHPPSANILFLWQSYLEVVDPLLKLFHVPSTQRHVMSMMQGRDAPDAATECLLFVIYYSAVISMPAAECRQELNEERSVLIQRYREGVERALERANFWSSHSITVLQAFVIYLICGRQDENGPDVCALIGVAIGNAMKLGIHINIPGMLVFDLEIRRRLWWQICTLDVRIAEDFGGEPFILEPSLRTELPFNINDISLDPDMGELPNPQPGRNKFCQSNGYQIMNETEKCQAVDQFRGRIEEQYLSYCYKGVPLDSITVKSSRLILAKLRLAVCKPRTNQNRRIPLRINYRKACEEVLEHAHILRQYSKGHRWLWLFQTYVEWDALAYLLLDICIALSLPSSSKPIALLWEVVDESYTHWKNSPDVHRDRRWANIEELRSQALSVIEKAQNAVQTPEASSSYFCRRTLDQSDGTSDTTMEMRQQYETNTDSMCNQRTTTTAMDIPVPLSLKAMDNDVQTPQIYITNLQTSEYSFSADQVSRMWAPTTGAATWTEVAQVPANTQDLPGTGTVCEWSSALIERYWEVAGQGYGGSSAWHSN